MSLNNDLYICLCYVVPDESSRQALIDTNIFDRILESVVYIESKAQNEFSMLICGDFNARSSNNPDFVLDDDSHHMNVLPDGYTPDQSMNRCSQDIGHVNNNGLLLLELCKQTGVRILNGRVGDDKGVGKFTFVGSRGYSVVDYVLASQDLFEYVSTFKVHDPNILSDHCLLSFSFTFGAEPITDAIFDSYEVIDSKFVWKAEFKNEYIYRLNDDATTEQLNSLHANISSCDDENGMNSCLDEFVSIFNHVCAPIFKKTKQGPPCNDFSFKKENPWYTEECNEKKNIIFCTY